MKTAVDLINGQHSEIKAKVEVKTIGFLRSVVHEKNIHVQLGHI